MYAVFDIGGTYTRIGVSKDGSGVWQSTKITTPAIPEEAISEIWNEITKFTDGEILTAVGGGIAGVFDKKKENIVKTSHLPGWEKVFSKRILEEKWRIPVFLENDAVLGALGEATQGAGRRKQIVAFVTISTGIGGARIVNGRIDDNTYGFEPGHQIIDVNNKLGNWEDFASGTALLKITGIKPEEINDTEIWDREARILAVGIHNLIVFWSPDIVVLGGSVMNKVPIEKIREYTAAAMSIFKETPPIEIASLGDNCTLYGALELLRQKLNITA